MKKKTDSKIRFALTAIKTEQFATLNEYYSENGDTELGSRLEFKFDSDEKMVGTFIKFSFEQNEKVFMIIEISCHFKIEEKTLLECFDKNQASYTFPKSLMEYLATITVGTTRGVLFAKTEGTPFSKFIIPLINVQKIITDDVVFSTLNKN